MTARDVERKILIKALIYDIGELFRLFKFSRVALEKVLEPLVLRRHRPKLKFYGISRERRDLEVPARLRQ